MGTELISLACREALAVDLHEELSRELPIWTVLLEPLVPLCDGGLVIPGVHHQELQVLCWQLLPGVLCSHDDLECKRKNVTKLVGMKGVILFICVSSSYLWHLS